METNTLNQWMKQWGYRWLPGKEQMMKALLTESQAQSFVESLERTGDVTNRGN